MIRKKLMYVVSDIDKSLHFEWISPHLNKNYNLSFVLIGIHHSALQQFLNQQGIPVICFSYKGRLDLIQVWVKVFHIILKQQPDIIHTHLWVANLIGLTCGWLAQVPKRIYTRHHASIHYKQYPSGLKWDKLHNRLATHIIAISKNVEHLLIHCDKATREKVRLIYHGFAFSYFQDISSDRVKLLNQNHNIHTESRPVIGVISRFTEWKGIQFIIPAFKSLLSDFPDARLILANAHGEYKPTLVRLLSDLPESSFTLINFEHDLAALYRLFDVFVHVPVDQEAEAFGQTYIEPLIVGIPCIFTLSGIAREIIKHEENALVVDFKNSEQIYSSMIRLLIDPTLRNNLLEHGKNAVSKFTIETYLSHLDNLYRE
ncbi:MAG: glycosyltransferase family 4 protein [Cyclobacteriaceae bacterium]